MNFRSLLDWSGLTAEELGVLLALVTMLAAVVGAMVRFEVRRPWRSVRLMLRLHERTFRERAIREWGAIQDPLSRAAQRIENHYIPLPVTNADGDSDLLVTVDELLADADAGNVILLGNAGSGKSTVLKKFAVSALRSARRGGRGGGPPPLPFYVQLRQLAADADWNRPDALLAYLMDQLRTRFRVDDVEAGALIGRALQRRRLVLLLDGLDEVRQDRREPLQRAVERFRRDGSRDCPTEQARIVLTCRQHNFDAVRRSWEAAVLGDPQTKEVARDNVYALAPLRDADIAAYVEQVRGSFGPSGGNADRYLATLYESPTLDMHRIPLVLATSVSYYTARNRFDIPSEIGELYRLMVTEMVTRHDFPEAGAQVQRFRASDKESFLREFAAANAIPGLRGRDRIDYGENFGPFSERALYQLAERLAGELEDVADHRAFVREILDHSGLLKRAGEGQWEFAHRTLQEYLVAEHLRAQASGEDTLLRHARDDSWQQVVVFYADTPALSQQKVGGLLRRLADSNLVLAGHCMRAAKPTNEVADQVIDLLAARIRQRDQRMAAYLNALLSTTLSPRTWVRDRGVARVNELLDEIIDDVDAFELLGRNVDSVVHLLEALSRTDAAHVAALVPKVVSAAPNDPRLVPPLWECLRRTGIESYEGAARIVERPVVLATDEDCFRTLRGLPPLQPWFVTPEQRRRVYPFPAGPRENNLVELLCWVDHLRVDVVAPNRFLQARRDGGDRFHTLLRDRARTRRVRLFPLGWVLSAGGYVAALAAVAVPWLVDGLPRWAGDTADLWWFPVPVLLAATGALTVFAWAQRGPGRGLLRGGAAPGRWRGGNLVAEVCGAALPDSVAQLVFLASGLLYAVALAPLLELSVLVYLAVTTVVIAVTVWVPLTAPFDRGRITYLRRPNEYTDMFEDPRSRHWLPGHRDTTTS